MMQQFPAKAGPGRGVDGWLPSPDQLEMLELLCSGLRDRNPDPLFEIAGRVQCVFA
jgi:hypothetical protein